MDRTRLDGSQIFAWLLVGLALVLLWAILQPFWAALLLAAVLAGVFSGLQRRLAHRLGGRAGIAAGLLTLLVLLAIVLPFAAIAGVLARELKQVIDSLRDDRSRNPASRDSSGGSPARSGRSPSGRSRRWAEERAGAT